MHLEITSKHVKESNLSIVDVDSSAVYRTTTSGKHRHIEYLCCYVTAGDMLHFPAVVAACIQQISLAELEQLQLDS